MKKLLLLFLLSLACVYVYSQRPLRTHAYYLGGGGNYPNFTEINKSLKNYRNFGLRGGMMSFQGGYARFTRRFVMGIEGNLMSKAIAGSVGVGAFDAYARFLSGQFRFGYVPFEYERIYFAYPTIGIGGATGLLKRLDNDSGTEIEYKIKGVTTEAALNFSVIAPMPDNRKTNFLLGITAGYLYTPMLKNTWQVKLSPSDKPAVISPQGGFFRLTMGMTYGR
jgi:hypothetical protein